MKEGRKDDATKSPIDLVSSEAIFRIADALEFGAKRYGRNNWRNGLAWSRITSAALRHLLAWKDGEDTDAESGHSHLAHAGACITFLLEYLKTHPELDDRPNMKITRKT